MPHNIENAGTGTTALQMTSININTAYGVKYLVALAAVLFNPFEVVASPLDRALRSPEKKSMTIDPTIDADVSAISIT